MGKSKAAPERLTAAERKQRAVELRKLGFSYQKIADQMGISVSGAHKMVTTALKEINDKTADSAEELRRLELERLDEWMLRVAQEIKKGKVLPGIDRGLRIMNRRTRLLGLDEPTRLQLREVDTLMFSVIKDAMFAGDPRGVDAFNRLSAGTKNIVASFMDFIGGAPACIVEAADIPMMTPEELEKAAQGKLTFEERAAIRERAGEDETEKQ